MLKTDNNILCDLCFTPLAGKNQSCTGCNGISNLQKCPTALKEGAVLAGRYAVGKILGKGGFGITYLCYDLKDNKTVAIKEYLPSTIAHRNTGELTISVSSNDQIDCFKEGARKFYEEAKTVAKFNGNPNIISVHEFFFENNTSYFVMEYLDGTDLKNHIAKRGGKLSEGEAIYLIEKVVDALMIVHSTGILHRDISPDNIFICANGDVKLIDFGAARQVVGEASKSLSVILKQGFAPLEQYQRKGNQGPWTDIYALGATLYYTLTGKGIDDAMTRLSDDTLKSDGISPEMFAVISKMLAVSIENRYQNTMELKAAMTALPIQRLKPVIATAKKSFCKQCGKEIASGELLCAECENRKIEAGIAGGVTGGSSQRKSREIKNSRELARQTVISRTDVLGTAAQSASPKKPFPKKILIIALAALLLIVGVVVAVVVMNSGSESEPDNEPPIVNDNPIIEEPTPGPQVVPTPPAEEEVTTPPEMDVPAESPIESVTFDVDTVYLETSKNETVTLTPVIVPADAIPASIIWESSDPAIAEVDANGTVTPKSKGTAIIKVIIGDLTAECKVEVNPTYPADYVEVTKVILTPSEVKLTVGEKKTLSVEILPENSTYKWTSWSSSNKKVATVSNGTVTAVGAGTAEITVNSDGVRAKCKVTVTAKTVAVTGIKLSHTTARLKEGESFTLKATLQPDGASGKIEWSSSNKSIATVDANGKVKAVKAGEVNIIAKAGGKEAKCVLTVTPKSAATSEVKVTVVKLDRDSADISVGSTIVLKATVEPSNATEKTVKWSSSNPGVATVDANGAVTAKSAGSTVITASCGGKEAKCTVNVLSNSEDSGLCGASAKWEFFSDGTLIISGSGEMNKYNKDSARKTIDTPWYKYSDRITKVNVNGVTSIGAYAFSGCTNLTQVSVANSVKTIDFCAFSGCTSLRTITIPNSVNTFGGSVFEGCSALQTVTLSNTATAIGDRMFLGCKALSKITLPNSITAIKNYAFKSCSALATIELSNKLESIGEHAFADCESLTKIDMPDTVTAIGANSFLNCKSLEIVNLSNKLETIDRYAFSGCSAIESIIIPNSVTNINDGAFTNCTSILSIEIPAKVTYIGKGVFSGWKNDQHIYFNVKRSSNKWSGKWNEKCKAVFHWSE